jgi:hypothetical protein
MSSLFSNIGQTLEIKSNHYQKEISQLEASQGKQRISRPLKGSK